MSSYSVISTPVTAATAYIVINGACYPSEFQAFAESSNDVILSCDFLTENGALIDYVGSENLLSDEPCYDIGVPRVFLKL